MAVPTYDKFIEPILRYLVSTPDGAPAKDAHDAAAAVLGVSDVEDRNYYPVVPNPFIRTALVGLTTA